MSYPEKKAARPVDCSDGTGDHPNSPILPHPAGETPCAPTAVSTDADDNVIEVDSPDHPSDLEEIDQSFWVARPSLAAIYDAALARMVAPWAVFANVAARVLSMVPPGVTLPPLVGGPGSLNWFGIVVARSGGGKSTATQVAAELFPYAAATRHVGSGEGVVECYWPAFAPPKSKDGVEDEADLAARAAQPKAFNFVVDEIDHLTANSDRSGSTLLSTLRTAFTGGSLGAAYRGRTNQIIPANEYRLTMVIAGQPTRCGKLLADTSGTPQRMQWFPGNDPRISAVEARPGDRIDPLTVPMNFFSVNHIEIPLVARDYVLLLREREARGETDASEGHAVFAREKIAFVLALLDGRTYINESDWELSGIVAAVSDHVRGETADAVRDEGRREASDRGQLRAVEQWAKGDEEDAIGRRLRNRVIDRIRAHLHKHGGESTVYRCTQSFASRDRRHVQPTLNDLQMAGEVDIQRDPNHAGSTLVRFA